jgi:hypothetical protein
VCGMSAGRRTSVQRHIDNPNIHNGNGRAVPFAGHRSRQGSSIGMSRTSSQISSSGPSDPENLIIRIEKEVENEIVREIARRIFNRLPKDDYGFEILESQARAHIFGKSTTGLLKEYLKSLGC